ncbi:MAG: hypothetical protein M1819_001826 [Sarea resinae]|nr:MAG: hypothetical protein M1819_001826 [Sarea resinae]
MSFEPSGHHADGSDSRLHLLHGTLPREPVCTENLTPFLKLLPCKGKAGISSLLDGHKLFDASWQSMAIDVRPVCPLDGSECILEIEQTVDMVLDVERSKRHRDNPIPRPIPAEDLACDTSKPYASEQACYPLDLTTEQPWSLTEIFGRPIRGSCSLTESHGEESETVCIDVPHERQVYTSAGAVERKTKGDHFRCYKLPPNGNFDIVLPIQPISSVPPLLDPPLYAERSFTGYGQERGGVQTLLTNPSRTNAIEFVYLESLPWFMKPYLHTLRAELRNLPGTTNQTIDTLKASTNFSLIKEIYYRPALDRHRGTHLELLVSLPPASTMTLTYDFEKAILRYTEYPPDANRGFDVAAAVIRLLSSASPQAADNHASQRDFDYFLRTTPLLLSLPTPDFSMPYNVIILTSTVMALAFGSVFNLLVRRFVGADEVERLDLKAVVKRVQGRIKTVVVEVLGKGRTGAKGKEKEAKSE